MKNVLVKRLVRAIPMLVVMVLIFGFSGGDGEESGSLSLKVTQYISEVLSKVGIDISVAKLHTPVRKFAHMSEYACLLITAMWAFWGIRKRYVIAFVFCVVYAITDEIHQLYVPGRCGAVTDVLIDTVGIIIGMLVYMICVKIRGFVRRRKLAADSIK